MSGFTRGESSSPLVPSYQLGPKHAVSLFTFGEMLHQRKIDIINFSETIRFAVKAGSVVLKRILTPLRMRRDGQASRSSIRRPEVAPYGH